MKEYFRIMFTDFDVMNQSDWDKWRKYSGRTLKISGVIAVIVWIINILI